MSKSIRLSPKHGLNPSIGHCPICGDDCSVILFGKLKDDIEAPRHVQNGLCTKCEGALNSGAIMIIEVRDGESGDNPYRTGYIIGLKEEAFKNIFPNHDTKKHRICYMEETVLKHIMGDQYKAEVNATSSAGEIPK